MANHSSEGARVDVSGLACPQPVAAVRRRLTALDPGDELIVEGADASAAGSIRRACETHGYDVRSEDGTLVVRVTEHASL
jgi:TusA-related sulfurtransferase